MDTLTYFIDLCFFSEYDFWLYAQFVSLKANLHLNFV